MAKPAKAVGFDNAMARGFLFPVKAKSKFKVIGTSTTVKVAEENNGNIDDEIDLSTERECNKCKAKKALNLFHNNQNNALGKSYECIECKNARGRLENLNPVKREKAAAYSKAYYAANKVRIAINRKGLSMDNKEAELT